MNKLKKTIATITAAAFITGMIPVSSLVDYFNSASLTAYADYSEESLLDIPKLQELIKSNDTKSVVFTVNCLTKTNPELNLSAETSLQK